MVFNNVAKCAFLYFSFLKIKNKKNKNKKSNVQTFKRSHGSCIMMARSGILIKIQKKDIFTTVGMHNNAPKAQNFFAIG